MFMKRRNGKKWQICRKRSKKGREKSKGRGKPPRKELKGAKRGEKEQKEEPRREEKSEKKEKRKEIKKRNKEKEKRAEMRARKKKNGRFSLLGEETTVLGGKNDDAIEMRGGQSVKQTESGDRRSKCGTERTYIEGRNAER